MKSTMKRVLPMRSIKQIVPIRHCRPIIKQISPVKFSLDEVSYITNITKIAGDAMGAYVLIYCTLQWFTYMNHNKNNKN